MLPGTHFYTVLEVDKNCIHRLNSVPDAFLLASGTAVTLRDSCSPAKLNVVELGPFFLDGVRGWLVLLLQLREVSHTHPSFLINLQIFHSVEIAGHQFQLRHKRPKRSLLDDY